MKMRCKHQQLENVESGCMGVHAGLLGAFEIFQFNQEEPDAPPAALTDSPAYDNYLVYHLLEKWGWGETSSVKLQQECLHKQVDQELS